MKLLAPTLNIDEAATAALIQEAVIGLQGKDDPYLILSYDDMTYAQTLWAGSGYLLEYQEGSIDQHYVSTIEIDAESVVTALVAYLSGQPSWNQGIEFNIKHIRTKSNRLGYALGYFIGKLFGSR